MTLQGQSSIAISSKGELTQGHLPAPEIYRILESSVAPCAGFAAVCGRSMRWQPTDGHVPRGWIGATSRSASTVRLIVVVAEPGDPADGEQYDDRLDARGMLAQVAVFGREHLVDTRLLRGGRTAPYHRNLQTILNLCWPTLSLDEQLERTWITSTVLCSAPTSGGHVSAAIERECVSRYLTAEIAVMPTAYLLALGDKAASRLHLAGIRAHGRAQHPSARPNTLPEVSWRSAAEAFQSWLSGQAEPVGPSEDPRS